MSTYHCYLCKLPLIALDQLIYLSLGVWLMNILGTHSSNLPTTIDREEFIHFVIVACENVWLTRNEIWVMNPRLDWGEVCQRVWMWAMSYWFTSFTGRKISNFFLKDKNGSHLRRGGGNSTLMLQLGMAWHGQFVSSMIISGRHRGHRYLSVHIVIFMQKNSMHFTSFPGRRWFKISEADL